MSGRASGWVVEHGPRPDDVHRCADACKCKGQRTGQPYGLARARALRAVLAVVADAANHEGEHSHPGLDNIVHGSLYSRRHVIDALAELVVDGWLRVEVVGGGSGRATQYAVCLDRREEQCSPRTVAESRTVQDRAQRVQDPTETVHPGVHPNGLATVSTTTTVEPAPPEPSSSAAPTDVETVFEAWTEATGHLRAKLDGKRRRLIAKALASHGLDDVLAAVVGWRHSPHHRGENDRATVYNGLGLLLRDAEQIEKFRDLELDAQASGTARVTPIRRDAVAERHRQREDGTACPTCAGDLWIDQPDGSVAACPSCSPLAAGA